MPSTLWNLVFIQIKWTFGSNDLLFPDTPNRPSVPSSFFIFFLSRSLFLVGSLWFEYQFVSVTDAWFEGQGEFQSTQKQEKKGRRKCVWNLFQWLAAAFNYYSFSRKGQWRPNSHRSSCRVGLSFCFFLHNKKLLHPPSANRQNVPYLTDWTTVYIRFGFKTFIQVKFFFWQLKRGTLFFTLLDEY